MTIAALMLAGGQGSRLGGVDKAFVDLHGKPLIDHLLARLAPQAAPSPSARMATPPASPPTACRCCPMHRICRQRPARRRCRRPAWAASIGAESLSHRPGGHPVHPSRSARPPGPGPSVAVYNQRQHHLVSLWPVSFLPGLKNFLAIPGAYKVRDALTLCDARQMHFAGTSDPFLNINTPDDLAAASPPEPG